jgi:hypothetical protein
VQQHAHALVRVVVIVVVDFAPAFCRGRGLVPGIGTGIGTGVRASLVGCARGRLARCRLGRALGHRLPRLPLCRPLVHCRRGGRGGACSLPRLRAAVAPHA